MKRRGFLLLICILFNIYVVRAESVTVYEGGLRYTVDTDAMTAEVYGLESSSKMDNLVIPDYIVYNSSQVPVISIRSLAFYNKTNLSGSLIIGNSVQTIGVNAFYKCSNFTSLTIGNSVQTIDNYAFSECLGFRGDLRIPDSVQTIGKEAFYNCENFNGSLTIGNSVQSIGESAFSECLGFTGDLRIPDSVQEIGERAFFNCASMTGSLTIGNSVQTIGDYAFGCLLRTMKFTGELVIPESVLEIGIKCFYGFENLTSLVISSSNTKIKYGAFDQCAALQSVTCLGYTPPECVKNYYNQYVFSSNAYRGTLYVPSQSIELYKNAYIWENFTNILPLQDEPTIITLNVDDLKIMVGQSYTLQATVDPPITTDQNLTWSSEGNEIASVTPEGKVTAVSAGSTTITVQYGEVSATCNVTVYSSGEIFVSPGSGTTEGEDDNSPAENTTDGGSLLGYDLTLRVGQTGVINLQLPEELTEIPPLVWHIEPSLGPVATMSKISDTQASFTGVTMGSTGYYVTVNGNPIVTGTITVIAQNPMTSLRLDPEEVSVAENANSFQIKAEYTPENAAPSLLTWTSSQPSVATVSDDGTVTILTQGQTTITATATDGSELSAECQVTVTKPIDENFDFDFSDAVMDDIEGITIYLEDTYQFKPQAKDGFELPYNIQWSSSESQTVSVTQDGLVKGEAIGTATITASAMVNGNDVKATCVVKVIPVPASTIEIEGQGVKVMKTTGTLQLKAVVMPENTTYADVTWQSSEPGVAQVNGQGLVTALTPGEVTITAFVTNQPTVKDEYTIQVQERLLGDANDNGVVNVADVGTISDYIVKKPVANFSFVNADVIPDNEITTADVTATIEIIFNDTPTVMTMSRSAKNHLPAGDRIVIDDFHTNGKEAVEIGIRLKKSIDYVGLQGSMQIPQGMTLERIERGPGASDHILNYNIADDGSLIFILYSLDKRPLAMGNDCLVRLIAHADESCEGIEFDNILASDATATQYSLTSTGGSNHGYTSEVEGIESSQIKIYSQTGGITVVNAQGELVNIYTLDGKRIVGAIAANDKETYMMAPGIYIVSVREINVKLIVR